MGFSALARHTLVGAAIVSVALGAPFLPEGRAQAPPANAGPWTAPPEAKPMQNPVKMDGQTVERGKRLYQRYCVPCHAADGTGSGAMAQTLGYKPANLSFAAIQEQTDGEIFWKISKGRSPMPEWEKQMSARERWDVVSYVRTLVKQR